MDSKLEELRLDIAELKAIEAQATRPKVKDILSIEVRKLETTYVQKLEQFEASKSASAVSAPKAPVQSSNANSYEIKLTNYAWDQSDKFVKLFVTLANVQSIPEANVVLDVTSRSVTLRVKELESKNYIFKVINFLEDIDPSGSYLKIKKDSVNVFLAKKKADKWEFLTVSDKTAKESRLPKIDKDGNGMMDLMKQMYEDGDDDMRRTIATAMMESRNKGGMPM